MALCLTQSLYFTQTHSREDEGKSRGFGSLTPCARAVREIEPESRASESGIVGPRTHAGILTRESRISTVNDISQWLQPLSCTLSNLRPLRHRNGDNSAGTTHIL